MEYPTAIVFFESGEQFISSLYYCQERDIEVVEAHFCGWHCLVLFCEAYLPSIIDFVKDNFGIEPFFMAA